MLALLALRRIVVFPERHLLDGLRILWDRDSGVLTRYGGVLVLSMVALLGKLVRGHFARIVAPRRDLFDQLRHFGNRDCNERHR